MQTTTDIDRFAVIKQAQHDRAAAEDAQHDAKVAAEREADKLLAPDLDSLLRLIGVLTEADTALTDNVYTVGEFTFSLVKSDRSSYIYLEIERALTEDEGHALETLLYRDSERLMLSINTDGLTKYTPRGGQLEQFRANVGDQLNKLRSDYDRLRGAMTKEAAKAEQLPVVVLDFVAGSVDERKAFESRAAELVKAGYKVDGYTAAYGLVSALFILSD